MKIGYITKEDPNDIKAYSGTHYSMYQALKKNFDEVTPLGPLDHWYKYGVKIRGKFLSKLSGKVYKYQYSIALAKKNAAILQKRIEEEKPDILFGSLVSPEVAYLKTDIPLYLTSDATFPRLNLLHKSHKNLMSESFRNAMFLEKKAFQKAKRLILPLHWLADSAIQDYGIDESKIDVISYGPNLFDSHDEQEINSLIQDRIKSSTLSFLFIGRDWEQKGGPKALDIVCFLNKLGIKSELKVLGCHPEVKSPYLEVLGFLDKHIPEEYAALISIFGQSHFFLLPTKAECVGMSFIEAASFGLPAIGSNVGGVPEAVLDGKTGYTFDLDAHPQSIAETIKKAWEDKSAYRSMSEKAYQHYIERMNWEAWGRKVREVVLS